jgi:DNA repair ATPase RecN
LNTEQKKLANSKERARSEQKNKNEQCKGYYEQLEKYSKAFSEKNSERSKRIRDLRNKYQIDSDEYKSNLQEINKQYSNILKNNTKPPSKPKNC